jgi:hypothetical protein
MIFDGVHPVMIAGETPGIAGDFGNRLARGQLE